MVAAANWGDYSQLTTSGVGVSNIAVMFSVTWQNEPSVLSPIKQHLTVQSFLPIHTAMAQNSVMPSGRAIIALSTDMYTNKMAITDIAL